MKNKGFSFVELLVAIAILGIISLPIASSFALSAKIDAKARETYSAANAADDVMLLVTEIDSFENYGKTVSETSEGSVYEVSCDLEYYLAHYEQNSLLTVSKSEVLDDESDVSRENFGSPEESDAESDPVSVYEITYNGYPIEMTVTTINESYYRIDLVLTYTVAGDTMQITRKGVLPVA